ncbi:hypothetical protein AWB77_00527 [Caballeronia fortuita]|uniref:Uncharacterized protein n=1 Tax=Caballeronia fortuita TaxID=1777138 RepID=A0A157ZDT8_9BURK|nr:hypothetical protein [Caballeronia fortuita]SAK43047.1 hypothetical protein AWB77_00527 [Caballeronia fortuita]
MDDLESLIPSIVAETTSTKRLLLLLQIAAQHPSLFATREALRKSVVSQGALARFGDESLNISPCSLNTLKAHARAELGGGWAALEHARHSAQFALTERLANEHGEVTPGRGTKAELENKLARLTHRCEQLKSDNWQLVKAVRRLLSNAESIIEQFPNDAVAKQVKTERAEILAMFSFLKQPLVVHDESKKE